MKINRLAVSGSALALCLGASAVGSAPAGAAPRAKPTPAPVVVSFEDAVPGVEPVGASKKPIYIDRAGRIMSDPSGADADAGAELGGAEAEMEALAFGCTPVSGRDNPHRSSTGVAVSGHGWWGKGDCSNGTADVLNCLYEYYTDGSYRQKACSAVEELKPGTGGSTNRTNARLNCPSTVATTWRNHVNVDVKGEVDTNEIPYNQAVVNCRVP